MEGRTVNPAEFIGFIIRFQGSEYPHLWYMLMLLGMYLMIPVLRLFVKRENKKYIAGIIIAAVIIQFGARTADFFTLNCGMHASTFLAKFHLRPLSGFMGLLLAGWYLNEYRLKSGTGKPLSYIVILYLVTLVIPFAVVKLTGNLRGIRRIFFHR